MTGRSLIAELEDAMSSRSERRRNETLRKVTDLFVGDAASYSQEQVAVFDGVIGRLAQDADQSTKAELSGRLAAIENAPEGVIGNLAADDAIDVAAPVLTNSSRLSDKQLAALAATKSPRHMVAIAGRRQLGEQVTDTLLAHGDQQVARAVATNAGARVSDKGYDKLADHAANDASLAECLVVRPDIPQRHFRMLITIAPEQVQRRLATTNPRLAERIRQAVAEARQASQAAQRDYSQAKLTVKALVDAGTLGDEQVHDFAKAGQFEETAVALAVLVRLPIDAAARLLTSEPIDTLLIAAKAAGLTWPTTKFLYLLRRSGRSPPQDIENARVSFIRLGPETAKQGLLFYKARAKEG